MTIRSDIISAIEHHLGEGLNIHPPAKRDALINNLADELVMMTKPESARSGWKMVPIEPTKQMEIASMVSAPCLCKQMNVGATLTSKWAEVLAAVEDDN